MPPLCIQTALAMVMYHGDLAHIAINHLLERQSGSLLLLKWQELGTPSAEVSEQYILGYPARGAQKKEFPEREAKYASSSSSHIKKRIGRQGEHEDGYVPPLLHPFDHSGVNF